MPNSKPTDESKNIRLLFSSANRYAVPSYQRAYSWENKHLELFLKDLREQPKDNPYYLGHFIFERNITDSQGLTYLIDGQQRMTTIALFMASVISILNKKSESIATTELSSRYLADQNGLRFQTVRDDLDLFEEILSDSKFRSNPDTNSKRRLEAADAYLRKELASVDAEVLLGWVKVIEDAHITTFTVHDKIQATQIFTLQNSRGKDLSELEKLKAYLMYQVYLHNDKVAANRSINSIEKQFEIIYRECEKTDHQEDQILRYHDHAHSPFWDSPTKNIERQVDEIDKASRIDFIKTFSKQLAKTYQDVVELEKVISHNEFIADPIILDATNSWPFILKLYNVFGSRITIDPEFHQLLRNVEITLVKFDFQHGRSSNYLINIAKALKSIQDLDELKRRFEESSQHSFNWRGDFNQRFLDYLNGDYHYHRITRYMLWKFENSSRLDKEAKVSPREYRNEVANRSMDATIEHIAPKEPQEEIYDQEFKDRYLHNLGNLLFMPKGLNSQLNNKSPLEKSVVLAGSSFATFRSVADQIREKGDCNCTTEWCVCKIENRKSEIIKFAADRWHANPPVSEPV